MYFSTCLMLLCCSKSSAVCCSKLLTLYDFILRDLDTIAHSTWRDLATILILVGYIYYEKYIGIPVRESWCNSNHTCVTKMRPVPWSYACHKAGHPIMRNNSRPSSTETGPWVDIKFGQKGFVSFFIEFMLKLTFSPNQVSTSSSLVTMLWWNLTRKLKLWKRCQSFLRQTVGLA